MGVAFDRHGQALALTLEAAHSRHRVLHAADTTGREVTTTLTDPSITPPKYSSYSASFSFESVDGTPNWSHVRELACFIKVKSHGLGLVLWY